MTQLQDILPITVKSPRQQREEDRIEETRRQNAQGFFSGVADAFYSEGIATAWSRRYGTSQYRSDPTFIFTDELYDELTADLPLEYHEMLTSAKSMPHAIYLRNKAQELAASRQRLAEMGFTGAALSIGASILDPAAIAADIGIALIPSANTAVWGSHLTRVQRLWRGGLVVAGTNVALEGILVTQDPIRQPEDLIYAAAGSFLLGGGINAIRRPTLTPQTERPLNTMRREIEYKNATDAGLKLTEKGVAYVSEPFKPPITLPTEVPFSKKLVSELVDLEFPEVTIKGARTANETLGVGAADRLLDRIDTMNVAEPARDYARLLARVFVMDKDGELHRSDIGRLVGLNANDLKDGDTFMIDARKVRVMEESPDGIKLEVVEPTGELPIGGLYDEAIITGGEIDTFLIPRDKTIPANKGSFNRPDKQPDVQAADGVDALIAQEHARISRELTDKIDIDDDLHHVTDIPAEIERVDAELTALRAPPAEIEPLEATLRDIVAVITGFRPRFQETRGGSQFFHGTSRPIDQLMDYWGSTGNIYGGGLYQTDAFDISVGYTRKGGGKQPTVYEASFKKEPKLFDLDALIDDDLRARIVKDGGEAAEILEAENPASLAELMDALREESLSGNISGLETAEAIDALSALVESRGFDGFTYKGGRLTKQREHIVKIIWQPEEFVDLKKVDIDSFKIDTDEIKALRAAAKDIKSQISTASDSVEDQINYLQRYRSDLDELARGGELLDEAVEGYGDAIRGIPDSDRVPDIIHNGPDLNFDGMVPPPRETGILGRARGSMSGRTMRSEVPGVRMVGRMLADDAMAGTRVGDMSRQAGSEWVMMENKRRMARWYVAELREHKAWAKKNKITAEDMDLSRPRFMEEVGRATRREAGTYTESEHVNTMSDFMRGEHKELLVSIAKRYGIKNFADIPENPNYLMRVHNLAAIDKLIVKHEAGQIEQLIAGSLMSYNGELNPKLALKIGRGYLRNVMKLGDETEVAKSQMFSGDNAEKLALILRDNVDDITEDEIQQVMQLTGKRTGDSNLISRARRRLELDETYRAQMADGSIVGIEDLLDNNAERLMGTYTRQILGAAAASQIYKDLGKYAGRTFENFDGIRNWLKREADTVGVRGRGLDKDLSRLETLHKSLLGMRLGDNTAGADALRLLRHYQMIRVGGQFGVAQIAELGQTVSQAGFPAILRQMPTIGRIFKRARDGEMSDELLRESEHAFGGGTDFLRNQVVARFDADGGNVERLARSPAVNRAEDLLKRGSRFVIAASGMAPINSFLQRLTMITGLQKWVDLAASGRIPSTRRLATIGIDEPMARRITAQINKYVKTEKNLFGRQARRMNYDEWDDLDAASTFIAGFNRWAVRVIQENDVGSLAQWMTTDLGRTVTQFRTFSINAWEKHLLFNLRMRDWETFTSWSATMIFGGLAYTAQQYANSIGRPDRAEYLERRLTTSEIAKAAFQRAGYSSLLPGFVDTVAPMMGFDRQFSYGRTSQMANDLLFGNPTVDFFNQSTRAMRGVFSPMRSDYDLSRSDINAMRQAAPFENVFGVQNMIHAMSSDLPRQSRSGR